MGYNLLITGATGFLGSALSVDLCRDHRVIGFSKRPPSRNLQRAAPGVQWKFGDVADVDCLDCLFKQQALSGHPIDYVIHFAAHIGFGSKWHDKYHDTNIIGTKSIIESACHAKARRILFASSVAALNPGGQETVLTETSFDYESFAYSKSKAIGENLIAENARRIPAVVLRLGGVFTDWCELPPLFSVMNLWSRPYIGRMVPGKGMSGFPYIHRKDVVRIVRRIIERDQRIKNFEVFYAAHPGCTVQNDLFPVIRRHCSQSFCTTPLYISRHLARPILMAKLGFNTMMKKNTFERPWMLRYVDRPFRVDTAYTRKRLDWQPLPSLHILTRLPVLVHLFKDHQAAWTVRNVNRNTRNYIYYPDSP